jgi:hypothetical protein
MQINTRNSLIAVGTDPIVVSEEKIMQGVERVRLILMNSSTGTQIITVSVGADPIALAGVVLNPGGSIQWERQAIPVQQRRVLASADQAGGQLSVYEEVLQ